MENNEKLINEKVKKAEIVIKNIRWDENFKRIYSFSTERINGYMKDFDLEDKSLLTVGSSSDQAINAFYNGCKDVTILDVNPFIKEFFELKKTAIQELDYKPFFKFMSKEGYFLRNYKAYNEKTFRKLIDKMEDEESKKFWTDLLDKENASNIRDNLFNSDAPKMYEIQESNDYLYSEENYKKLKNKIKNFKPNFIVGDIYKYELNRNYDNIFLSNIADYYEVEDTLDLKERLEDKLNKNGKMLVTYMYQTDKDSKYENEYSRIYDLKETLKKFKDCEFKTFEGVNAFELKYGNPYDSAIVYTKK